MKALFALGIAVLLGMGALSRHDGMTHEAIAQTGTPASQAMMLAAQEHQMMNMGEKPGAGPTQGMSGCGMGGGQMGMTPDKGGQKGGMMGGGMMGGMDNMGGVMGCPMMTQAQGGKGMSCCCANMVPSKGHPKKPA